MVSLKILLCSLIQTAFSAGITDVTIEDVPYQASINIYGNGENVHCGAAIVTKRHVMTAAHCVAPYIIDPDFIIEIRLGSNKHYIGGSFHTLYGYALHPKFDIATEEYGIAILLYDPILEKYDSQRTKAILPMENEHLLYDGDELNLAGWGVSVNGQETLQNVVVPKYNSDECGNLLNTKVYDSEWCVGTDGTNGPEVKPNFTISGITAIYKSDGQNKIYGVLTQKNARGMFVVADVYKTYDWFYPLLKYWIDYDDEP